ncbi:hypothetical protein [Noviherbaspirillum sedimenti]|uniref:Uncharacterized protein n=1 Tax=Noviherbaspirillum sedimenti TaxID=2320865 RepID=A0A3A3G1X7_9BURK|nr:hypothetical protein [Noviherbaspirillum sedimenti]RJG01931.1 hypothetical protein D3878_10360 [Noviherbaspirillum sedimenti]
MLAQTMASTGLVFSKTEKGREEMSSRAHGLTPMQRRVLIIIDGSKDLETIIEMVPAMVPSGQLQEILSHLLEHGFIAQTDSDARGQSHAGALRATPVESAAPAPAPAARGNAPVVAPAASGAEAGGVLTEDPATIRLVKDFMTTTAQTYLGLLSAPVIQRIEKAGTPAQLMAVAGHWNMALRDSPQGKRFASPYLDQVKSALVTGAKVVLGEANSSS